MVTLVCYNMVKLAVSCFDALLCLCVMERHLVEMIASCCDVSVELLCDTIEIGIYLYILNAVRCPYVCNAGRGQLSSE